MDCHLQIGIAYEFKLKINFLFHTKLPDIENIVAYYCLFTRFAFRKWNMIND